VAAVLGGSWMGDYLEKACRLLKAWSWRRELNPRPSDYKFEGMAYEGVQFVKNSNT
jgi:hypothetical protein